MNGSGGSPTLVWFRQDPRLSDHPALAAALKRKRAVLPVYVRAPEEEGTWTPGAVSKWRLHHSLADLGATLGQFGSRLILRRGPTEETLSSLAAETGAGTVLWNRRYEPAAVTRGSNLKSKLRARGLLAESFNASLLYEPWTTHSQSGEPFRGFAAFWRATRAKPVPPPVADYGQARDRALAALASNRKS